MNMNKPSMMNTVSLRKIEKCDMEYIYKWFSDSEFLKYYDYVPPVDRKSVV